MRSDGVDHLWATSMSVDSIDLALGRVVLRFTSNTTARQQTHVVRLERVRDFRVALRVSATWQYAEASEVGLDVRDGVVSFGVVIWNEPSELTVECEEAWLDDVLLANSTGLLGITS